MEQVMVAAVQAEPPVLLDRDATIGKVSALFDQAIVTSSAGTIHEPPGGRDDYPT